MANKLITLVVGIILATTAQAQENEDETTEKPDTPPQCAFGYCMGQSIDEEPEGKNDYGLWYVSKKHDLFDGGVYALWTNSTGVCMVKGFYEVPSPDDYGNAHRRAFNMLSDLVKHKYGEPSVTIDSSPDDIIWGQSMHWLRTLETGERELYSGWFEEPSILPPGLKILVDAESSAIEVEYSFANFDECMEEGKSAVAEDF